MGKVTDAISAHHRELATKLEEQVAALEAGKSDGKGLVRYLQTELLPHAAGEEAHIYPVVATLVKEHGTATATMSLDHKFIERATQQVAELSQAIEQAKTPEARAEARQRLTRLAIGLETVVRLHTDKEEQAYLPLIERYVPADEQATLLDEVHETAAAREEATVSGTAGETPELDVRSLPPAQRHALIFRTFDALKVGQAFVMINDHDPKPLYYQLNFEYQGQLAWDYLESGPVDWRVRIGKSERPAKVEATR